MQESSEDLEKLYLPSRWSKRLPPDQIVEKHVEFASKESDNARKNIPSTLNIAYGLLDKEKIDIFGSDLNKDAPIFVFVHGGYWQEESLKRDTYHFIASILYKNGIKSIFIGYELCPKVSLDEIIQEIEVSVKKCIDYAREKNSKGLFLAGYSAGSHLVATLYTNLVNKINNEDRNVIKSVFLIAGIYDLTQIPKTSINEPLLLTQENAVRLSPQKCDILKNVSTSFYIISAENDSPEFKKQSADFHEKIKKSGIKSTAVVVKNVDHFDIVELLTDEEFKLSKLILDTIEKFTEKI